MTELLKMIHSMKKLYDHLCLDVMGKYDMTRSELDILLFLYNHPEFDTAKDIVEKRGLGKSHTSMGIDKLIKRQYLEAIQDEKDKRKYHLYLLPLSQEIIEDGLKTQKHFQDILFKGFSIDEKKSYQKMLQNIYENIIQEEAHL